MKLRYIISTLVLAGIASSAHAQMLESAYFLDGYAYGHELNPAKDYDRGGYISFPILGNNNVSVNGNLSLSNLLYKRNGNLVTFLHPDVPVDEALSNFHDNNKLITDIHLEVLSLGFHAFGGFNTIGVSIRENMGANIPYDFFDLAKNLQNRDYNLSSFGASAQSYVEIGIGHSHDIVEGVRIGAKVKALLGIARADVEMNNLSLKLSDENKWTATADAEVKAYAKGLTWGAPERAEYNSGETYERIDFDNIDFDKDNTGISGVGVGVDVGAEVDFGKLNVLPGLKVSAAVTDLGFIKWKDGISAVNQGEPFEFDGFNNVQVKDGSGTPIEDQTDDLGDRLTKLYSLHDNGAVTGDKTHLGSTLRVGAEYALPQYDKLSFGLLYTKRFQDDYGWNETRLSATISPLNWLEASANVGIGTFGTSVGWVFNLHPKGFNVFVGMDHILGKVSKQYIPVNSNSDITFGINFPFGQLQSKKHKKEKFDKLDKN